MDSTLQRCVGNANRFVVVDVETTGVFNRDRVLEIAIVTLSMAGTIVDVYDTLILPGNKVDATHIHGISTAMVQGAPTFKEIAGDIAERLHGACVVAHNLSFDARMLRLEYERLGHQIDLTNGIDTMRAHRAKLHIACANFGIDLKGAHSAFGDARATAELFLKVASRCSVGEAALTPSGLTRSGKVKSRQAAHL